MHSKCVLNGSCDLPSCRVGVSDTGGDRRCELEVDTAIEGAARRGSVSAARKGAPAWRDKRQPVPPRRRGSARINRSASVFDRALEFALNYVAESTGARWAILVCPGRSWATLAAWEVGRISVSKVRLPGTSVLMVGDLAMASFLYRAESGEALIYLGSGGGQCRQGLPVAPWLAEHLGSGDFLSVPVLLRENPLGARLFLACPIRSGSRRLAGARAVGLAVSAILQQASEAAAAISADRRALACDLHDGALQILAGTTMQMRAAAGLIATDPEQARACLDNLHEALTGEHRALRRTVDRLRARSKTVAVRGRPELARPLAELVRRLEAIWSVTINCQIRPRNFRSNPALDLDLLHTVREGVANAVRHGGARTIRIDVRAHDGKIDLTIIDDGCGIRCSAARAHAAPACTIRLPRSLRERAARHCGQLTIHSEPDRTTLKVQLPVAEEFAA